MLQALATRPGLVESRNASMDDEVYVYERTPPIRVGVSLSASPP